MDVLIEFLLSLILESSFELARSKRVSKWVRYPLIVLLSLLVLSLIIGTPVLGVYLIAVTGGSFGVTMGVILLALSALIIYLFVRKVRAVMSSRSSLSFDLLDISDESSVNELSSMASEIWHEHYDPILGRAQVDYMVERFLSPAAIKEQVGEGYSYRFAVAKGRKVGFLPRGESETVSNLMDAGKQLFAQIANIDEKHHWAEVAITVFLQDD